LAREPCEAFSRETQEGTGGENDGRDCNRREVSEALQLTDAEREKCNEKFLKLYEICDHTISRRIFAKIFDVTFFVV